LELEVTVPTPIRRLALLTLRVNVCRVKVAMTNLGAFMLTVQVAPETASHPLQPVNDQVAELIHKTATATEGSDRRAGPTPPNTSCSGAPSVTRASPPTAI